MAEPFSIPLILMAVMSVGIFAALLFCKAGCLSDVMSKPVSHMFFAPSLTQARQQTLTCTENR